MCGDICLGTAGYVVCMWGAPVWSNVFCVHLCGVLIYSSVCLCVCVCVCLHACVRVVRVFICLVM